MPVRPSHLRAGVFALLPTLSACAERDVVTIEVLAASSMMEAFTELEATFESENPGVDVVIQYAGTQVLATQLIEGASADLFVSAGARHLERARSTGRLGDATVIAGNQLMIAARDVQVDSATALAANGVRVVIAHQGVPAGRATAIALKRLGLRDAVTANVVSFEPSARRVLTKLALGEADAGIVYASDARDANEPGLSFAPLEASAVADVMYFLARVDDSHVGVDGRPAGDPARTFAEFIAGPRGEAILRHHGFASPR